MLIKKAFFFHISKKKPLQKSVFEFLKNGGKKPLSTTTLRNTSKVKNKVEEPQKACKYLTIKSVISLGKTKVQTRAVISANLRYSWRGLPIKEPKSSLKLALVPRSEISREMNLFGKPVRGRITVFLT